MYFSPQLLHSYLLIKDFLPEQLLLLLFFLVFFFGGGKLMVEKQQKIVEEVRFSQQLNKKAAMFEERYPDDINGWLQLIGSLTWQNW